MRCIDYSDIGDTYYVEAIKIQDIVKFRMIHSENIKENIVTVNSPVYGEVKVKLPIFIKNYHLVNGKRIKPIKLMDDRSYVGVRRENRRFRVLYIPEGNSVNIDDKKVNGGVYLVVDNDGNPRVVSKKMFSKMFYIPNQPVLKRLLEIKRGKVKDSFNKIKQNRKVINPTIKEVDSSRNNNRNNINRVSTENSVETSTQRAQRTQRAQNTQILKYIAVGVIYRNNVKNGFVIKCSNGQTRNLPFNKVKEMCDRGLINNLTTVRKDNGKIFFRGIGCSIDNLKRFDM